jgi:putative chitinase
MYKITEQQLKRAVPDTNSVMVKEFVAVFNEWSDRFGINTPIRVAHFLAQCWHESGALRYVEEIASGAQYEGRKDLGNTQPGDGKKFKGRAFIQVTGRRNYQAYQDSGFCVGNLMAHPEWLTKSPGHTKASMWFWWKNGLSAIADTDNGLNANDVCKKITKRINGGYNGLSQRLFYMRRFKKEFGI